MKTRFTVMAAIGLLLSVPMTVTSAVAILTSPTLANHQNLALGLIMLGANGLLLAGYALGRGGR